MRLKATYDTEAEIPQGFSELYLERGGKFVFYGVEGTRTQADVDGIQRTLVKERVELKAVKDQLAAVTMALGDIDPTTIPAALEELHEARARLDILSAGRGTTGEAKVAAQIEAAVSRAVGPVQRNLDSVQRDLEAEKRRTAEKDREIVNLRTSGQREKIRLAIRDAVVAAKVLPAAVEDAVLVGEHMFEINESGALVTKNEADVPPGLSPKEWTKDMVERRPHWWGAGDGDRGPTRSASENPWSPGAWNVTAQGAYVLAHGVVKAAELAARAGSKIGATRPTRPPA